MHQPDFGLGVVGVAGVMGGLWTGREILLQHILKYLKYMYISNVVIVKINKHLPGYVYFRANVNGIF